MRNRRILLSRRPHGIPVPSDFETDETDVPTLSDGQIMVRNLYLSVDPAQRGWASDGTNYAAPVPLGGVMRALAVGVVEHSLDPVLPAGTTVYGWFGWQEFAVVTAGEVLTRWTDSRLSPKAYAGILGINGLTAYLAFHQIGRPVAGETVLVSTAAGSVGSVVGQLARLAGCRTIGLTSSDAKIALCRERFGYDVALDYRAPDLAGQLEEAAPDGFDIFFDNTGGDILDTGLRRMRTGGRIVQCGTASVPAWSPPPQGMRNEREVLTRRLVWGGFVIFDHIAHFDQTAATLAGLIAQGKLVYEEDIRDGLESAPQALADLYDGANRGKTLIALTGQSG